MVEKTIYGAEIVDLGLLVDETLIIANLHLGYEQALNKDGIMVPRFQYKKILERLQEIIHRKTVIKVIVNGDLETRVWKDNKQEWS